MAATICPRPVTLTFDLLTLKSVWESHVTWGTPVQSFVFLGLLVFELEPMYATSDRRTKNADDRLMPPRRGIITQVTENHALPAVGQGMTSKLRFVTKEIKMTVKMKKKFTYYL